MVTEKMNRDAAIGLYCRLNEIDWDQEKVEQTDHFERWYATVKAALSTDAEPVAFTNAAQLKKLSDPSRWHEATICPVGDGAYDIPLYAEPVKIDDYKTLFEECQLARDEVGFLGSVPDCIRYLEAELNAVKTAPTVAVKALEWEPYNIDMLKAETFFGVYVISASANWWLRGVGDENMHQCRSIEEAKRQAQADNDELILSALSAQVQAESGYSLDQLKAAYIAGYAQGNCLSGTLEGDEEWEEYFSCVVDTASPASKHGDAE